VTDRLSSLPNCGLPLRVICRSLLQVLRKSVLGMLAKNNLRYDIARKLRIFPGPKHFHEDKLPPGTPSVL
jgi:ribosomal protein L13